MSEQTLKLGNVVVSKKEFHASKQAISLNLVDTSKIVGSEYFVGYLHNDGIIRPLCIILLQMSGYINFFDDGGKKYIF